MKIELSEDEAKIISEILRYSLGSCPVESISDQVHISTDKVEDLAARLEQAVKRGS